MKYPLELYFEIISWQSFLLHSCCRTPPSSNGLSSDQSDACCHTEGFDVEEPVWQCNKDHGSGNTVYVDIYKSSITIT